MKWLRLHVIAFKSCVHINVNKRYSVTAPGPQKLLTSVMVRFMSHFVQAVVSTNQILCGYEMFL